MTAELLGQRQNPSLAAKESRHLAEQIHFQLGRSASPNMEPGRKMWEQITKADLELASGESPDPTARSTDFCHSASTSHIRWILGSSPAKTMIGEPSQGAAFSAPVYRLFDAVCDLELPVRRRTHAAAAGAVLAALKKDGPA
jgi:hypothetical protein